MLGRSPSTICRELARNKYANGSYAAFHAQKLANKRKHNAGIKPILSNETLKREIIFKLSKGWSAEQICGKMKLENPNATLSPSTIYRAVDNKVLPQGTKNLMRFKWKYKKKKHSEEKRGIIPNRTSIHDLPPREAALREILGYWESDTVIGMRKTGCIGTHVERKTGFLLAFYMKDRKENIFNELTAKHFSSLDTNLRKAFIVDNGKEFAQHEKLSNDTNMKVYFCDPNSPWQKGLNENTNGLLRYYLSKGSSFAHLTQASLSEIVDLINDRPRKRFNYKTPREVMKLEVTSVALNVQT